MFNVTSRHTFNTVRPQSGLVLAEKFPRFVSPSEGSSFRFSSWTKLAYLLSVARRASSKRPMKTVSLFSGIGGLDLGLEDAGHEIILQVESDPHCVQASSEVEAFEVRVVLLKTVRGRLNLAFSLTLTPQVLQYHFPGRALHRDVAEITELPPETELLAAGFPCPVRS